MCALTSVALSFRHRLHSLCGSALPYPQPQTLRVGLATPTLRLTVSKSFHLACRVLIIGGTILFLLPLSRPETPTS